MKQKGNVHETHSLLFAQEGVPSQLVMDRSKEQTQGELWCKA